MINHFRSTLMNISEAGVISEHIAPSFQAVTLSAPLQAFRLLLYPNNYTRSDILRATTTYTQLLESCGLSDAFTLRDPRLTYTLADLTVFKQSPANLVTLADTLIGSIATNAMIATGSNHPKYVDMYNSSPFRIQRLAAAIANYSTKLA